MQQQPPKRDIDPVPLLLELFNVQEQLAKPTPPGSDPRLLVGLRAGRKNLERRADEIKDMLVDSLRQRALPVVLQGCKPDDEQRFVAAVLRDRDAVVADASLPYRTHVEEIVLFSGGKRHDDGSYTMPAVNHQFTAEYRLRGLVAIDRWKDSSYYGHHAFLESKLHQPAEMRAGRADSVFFSTPQELVDIWRPLLRLEGVDPDVRKLVSPDEYGRCAVLDAVRGACALDRVVENPVVIIRGVASAEEAHNLGALFVRKSTIITNVPDKRELRKQVEQVLGTSPTNTNQTKEKN